MDLKEVISLSVRNMLDEPAVKLLSQFEALGIRVWIDGGWAVDALLRQQTRPKEDFNPGNFLFQPGTSGWKVSALFDFTTGYLGDPLADLPRPIFEVPLQTNTRSRAIPERLGFQQEGVIREAFKLYGTFNDSAVYGMLDREWKVLNHC